jgi:TonB family protein
MVQAGFNGASPNAHLLVGEMPAPRQLVARSWEGTGLSIAAHAIALGVLIFAATHVPEMARTASSVSQRLKVVFLDRPGPAGGGGGGGRKTSERLGKAEIAAKAVQLQPAPKPLDTPQPPQLNIPIVTVQAGQMLPGAFVQVDITSPGPGFGIGGGGGRGPGNGPGEGPGLGAGRLGGFGGDEFPMGNGVTPPALIKEVKPNYTGDAMRAKVQGLVEMDAVVLADGSVDPGRIRITRSLDATFGLDQEAMIAVRQWRFRPATFKGQPVAARVSVVLTFTLR